MAQRASKHGVEPTDNDVIDETRENIERTRASMAQENVADTVNEVKEKATDLG